MGLLMYTFSVVFSLPIVNNMLCNTAMDVEYTYCMGTFITYQRREQQNKNNNEWNLYLIYFSYATITREENFKWPQSMCRDC